MKSAAVNFDLDTSSSLTYVEHYIDPEMAGELFNQCLADIEWEQSEITLFGRKVSIPRLNAWYGTFPYTYSGKTFHAKKLPQHLQRLKVCIEKEFGIELNSVLANLYRDGNDGMGWHSDNEKTLGASPQIASISLGGKRRFVIRSKTNKLDKKEIELGNGSLLIMRGECQRSWEHSIPKTTKHRDKRINLTFRQSFRKTDRQFG